MELKLDWPIYELLPCCLLIAPLMELKFGNKCKMTDEQILLIAPLMELKWIIVDVEDILGEYF